MPTPPLRRRAFTGAGMGAVAWALLAGGAPLALQAAVARPERARVALSVASLSEISCLPLVVAEQLGYFRAAGLEIDWVEGGAAAPEVSCGPFEQVIQLQGRGQLSQAFVVLGRAPALALGVSTRSMPQFRRLPELRGRRIGVTALGSTAHLMARLALQRAGVAPSDVQFVDVGGGAPFLSPSVSTGARLFALRSGQVEALCAGEPSMTQLEQHGEVRIGSDTRSLRGAEAVFGGPMPACCLHAPEGFIQRNPGVCQVLADGVVRALKWLQTAGPRDLLRSVPEAYLQGDLGLYLAAFERVRETVSVDGVLPLEGGRTALRALAGFDPALRAERIDLARTFTNDFAQRARERLRG